MEPDDRQRVIRALNNESRRLERLAGARLAAGQAMASYRAGLRADADRLDALAAQLRDTGRL